VDLAGLAGLAREMYERSLCEGRYHDRAARLAPAGLLTWLHSSGQEPGG